MAINTGYSANIRYWFILQRGVARKGYLRRRITVTLSIFNFSSWFLAQIVENRGGVFLNHFYVMGIFFLKSYDENQIRLQWECVRTPWSGGWWVTSRSQITSSNVFQDGFRHNFSKSCPQDLKFVWKDASRDSQQFCTKKRVLKLNIDKVKVIIDTRITLSGDHLL